MNNCADTGCSLEDLPGVMDDRDGWCVSVCVCVCERERERERVCKGTPYYQCNLMMIY